MPILQIPYTPTCIEYLIKDVPAHICENCGEKYFDAHITREVLQKLGG